MLSTSINEGKESTFHAGEPSSVNLVPSIAGGSGASVGRSSTTAKDSAVALDVHVQQPGNVSPLRLRNSVTDLPRSSQRDVTASQAPQDLPPSGTLQSQHLRQAASVDSGILTEEDPILGELTAAIGHALQGIKGGSVGASISKPDSLVTSASTEAARASATTGDETPMSPSVSNSPQNALATGEEPSARSFRPSYDGQRPAHRKTSSELLIGGKFNPSPQLRRTSSGDLPAATPRNMRSTSPLGPGHPGVHVREPGRSFSPGSQLPNFAHRRSTSSLSMPGMARHPSYRHSIANFAQVGGIDYEKARVLLKRNKPLPRPIFLRDDLRLCRTSGERALLYAQKINELSLCESGLELWIACVRPPGELLHAYRPT